MNGIIVPTSGGLNQIIANDLSSSVTCNNGGIIDMMGNVGDFTMLENAIVSS